MSYTTLFNYSDFSSTTGLSLAGVASVVSNKLRISSVAAAGFAGATWHALTEDKFYLPWRSTFVFNINNMGGSIDGDSNLGGDGFTFSIHQDSSGASTVGGAGGGVGIDGVHNTFSIVFDTWKDPGSPPDPSGHYVSYWGNGNAQLLAVTYDPTYRIAYADTPRYADSTDHTVVVQYDGVRNIKTFIDGVQYLSWNANIAGVPCSLPEYLGFDVSVGTTAWVGFTAASGIAWENHDIISWEFISGKIPDLSLSDVQFRAFQ